MHSLSRFSVLSKLLFSSTRLVTPLLLGAVMACSGGDGDDQAANDGASTADSAPISMTSAAGLWNLHYEWSGAPPAEWTMGFGPASGDRHVAFPSPAQKRGILQSDPSPFGFAPMSSTAEDGSIHWSIIGTGPNGPFSIDFTGTGTGSTLSGEAKSNGGASAKWTATKVSAPLLPLEELAGDWTIDFQWYGRTPGELLVQCTAAGSCTIPHGQDGGPATDDVASVTTTGNQIVLKFQSSTHFGVPISNDVVWGYMDSTEGNSGVWTATRGAPSGGGGDDGDGCTADVDCGSCERCERTTGTCIARLTC
jgi:hypothetical protein